MWSCCEKIAILLYVAPNTSTMVGVAIETADRGQGETQNATCVIPNYKTGVSHSQTTETRTINNIHTEL